MSAQERLAASVIRKHYGLALLPSAAEIEEELVMLDRKARKGSLCGHAETLAAALSITSGGAYRFPRSGVDE